MTRTPLRSPAFWLGLALLAAGLLNGIGPYLRRTGLIETNLYERFWDLHTGPTGFARSPLGLGRRCVVHRPIEEGGAEAAGGGPPAQYVFTVRRWELPVKALKDVLLITLVAGSFVAWARGRSRLVPLLQSWPALALTALVTWQAVAGLLRGAPMATVAGLRSFAFLGIAVTAGWVTAELLQRLVPWFVGLLALQLLLSPLEFLRGIPVQGHMVLFGEVFARRASGTFVMPNTLGVFAACVVALAAGFGEDSLLRGLAWVLGGLVVLVSGSGTGIVMLAVVGLSVALFERRRPNRLALAGIGVALVVAAFLLIRGRPDVGESLEGRVEGMRSLAGGTPLTTLFGRGIGLGTNTEFQTRVGLGNEAPTVKPVVQAGESAVAAVILQTGFAGLALLATSLGLAFARSVSSRPLVLALCAASLTLNLTEAFPVSLLLGLVLACAPEESTILGGHGATLLRPIRSSAGARSRAGARG